MKKKCVLCKKHFIEYGFNAEPVKKGLCCQICNLTVVIPARMAIREK